MIRIMKASDLAQCGRIYAKAFPIEHWGIDWTTENATDYLQDFFEQKRFVGLPKRQDIGIGKQLLKVVKDYSKNNGLAGIVLYTSEYAPAAKFYEKNGFKLSNGTNSSEL